MKILIVQTGFLGDTILSTPVIAGVKKLFPQAEVWMLTTPQAAPLVERDPLLTGVLHFEKRGKGRGLIGLIHTARTLRSHRFDRVYSLHRSYRTAFLLTLARIPYRVGYSDAAGARFYTHRITRTQILHDVLRRIQILSLEEKCADVSTELRLFPPPLQDLSLKVKNLMERNTPYVVIAPGSAWATKRWTSHGFHTVGKMLVARGYEVILIGSPDEHALSLHVQKDAPFLNLVGELSLSDLLSLIQQASLVICNDSMALHTASAFKTPCVAIFCATTPFFGFGPWQNWAVVVQNESLKCRPCALHGGKSCPTGTNLCMTGISVQEVVMAIDQVLDWSRGRC